MRRTIIDYWGYVRIWVQNHPAFGTKWVRKAHLVWWNKKHQLVPPGWVLHHRNEVKTDNRFRNLQLVTQAQHARIHTTGKKWPEARKQLASHSAIKRCTPEWRKRVSERVKKQHKEGKFGRRTWSAEAELKHAEKMRRMPHRTGWHHTKEVKAKISKSHTGKPKSPEHIRNAALARHGHYKGERK